MRFQKALFLPIAMVLTCFLFGSKADADEKPIPPNEFDGKYLVVTNKGNADFYLEKVKLKKLGDSYFLVGMAIGTGIKEFRDWENIKGSPVWVQVSDIAHIVIYPSKEQLVNAVKTANRPVEKPDKK